jgi:hypothetical protein
MSSDMNPMRHVWNFISSKVNQRNPECQNIAELTNAIPEEWRRFPQERPQTLLYPSRSCHDMQCFYAARSERGHPWNAIKIDFRLTNGFVSNYDDHVTNSIEPVGQAPQIYT